MFKKILIANRGEIAMRIIRSCKEMGIQTGAVYSKADEESLHVRFADEAVCIGPADSSESYLKTSNIIAAAEITNADAIHPGYGFLSENSKFSKICDEHKIKFIGASPEMIDKMGDKSSAKETMKKAGVPTIPGSEGIVETLENAQKIAQKIGFDAMFQTGYGTSASLLGMPDYGFIGATETLDNARRISNAISVPLIVDVDTGFGDVINVSRTVKSFEQIGVCLLYTSPSPRDKRQSRMPSSA